MMEILECFADGKKSCKKSETEGVTKTKERQNDKRVNKQPSIASRGDASTTLGMP